MDIRVLSLKTENINLSAICIKTVVFIYLKVNQGGYSMIFKDMGFGIPVQI